MSYATFHLYWILPPIAVLALAAARTGRFHRRDVGLVALLSALALVYTTPWDNYLVYREVWGYGTDRVWGTIGYVPVEEYLFFVLQPILTGLFLLLLLARIGPVDRPPSALARRIGAVSFLVMTGIGIACLFREPTLYLGLILAWAGPVAAGQWFLAGEQFTGRAALIGIGVPTAYLWIADRMAIADGIWSISPRYTVGFEPLGLPIEEAVFFLVTNVLVVQGILMFRPLRRNDRSRPSPAERTRRPASGP